MCLVLEFVFHATYTLSFMLSINNPAVQIELYNVKTDCPIANCHAIIHTIISYVI